MTDTTIQQPTPDTYDEAGTISRVAWRALGVAALMARQVRSSPLLDMPPPKRPRNPKREAQKAQRKARRINRG